MKFALATICLAVLLIGVHSAPQTFNLGGMEGVINGMEIVNGEKKEVDVKSFAKAEELLKAMIYKHLNNKKQAKKAARKEKALESVAQAVLPENIKDINWNEHPETQAMINEKVPGGTEAVDALIKLVQEREAHK